ncbi:MAG: hypothetical protein ACRDQ7_01285 [Haloechinothrix sp.]
MRDAVDPVIDVEDKLPCTRRKADPTGEPIDGPVPFGLLFAVSPLRMGKHGKTYYTVTETERTQVSSDGKVEIIQDSVERERED